MRKTGFYPRLAAQNIRKNGRFYLPYLLALVGCAAAFYIVSALAYDEGIQSLRGANYVTSFMLLGMIVLGLFLCIFLLYTNSFLIKRRQKEFGLYNVLGLGKGNIARMMCWEELYIALIGIGGGLVLGLLLHKLGLLLLYKMLRLPAPFGFGISLKGIVTTVVLFAFLLALTLLMNILRMRKLRAVELLHAAQAGEREPKTRLLLTLVGLVSLAAGYVIALSVESGGEALMLYFVAVFLVIIGTYCLFTAVSIFVLKALRMKKSYYYKTAHFIGVSGMLHRMKQNAVGLANICILSTMVMVMVSGTLSMYLGVEQAVAIQAPASAVITARYRVGGGGEGSPDLDGQLALTRLSEEMERLGAAPKSAVGYDYCDFFAVKTAEGELRLGYAREGEEQVFIYATTPEGYTAETGEAPPQLAEGQIGLAASESTPPASLHMSSEAGESFSFEVLPLAEVSERALYTSGREGDFECCYLVTDLETIKQISLANDSVGSANWGGIHWIGLFEFAMSDEEVCEVLASTRDKAGLLGNDIGDMGYYDYMSDFYRDQVSSEMFAMSGGFLFLGAFLGLVFLMATALIMYYKQVSEGYEDKRRFEIMRQVGLDEDMARQTIRSQILTVFFLPIVVAAMHIAFDFNFVTKLLAIFYLTDVGLTALCTAGTLLAFALVYGLVYGITARSYYKIVRS